MNALFYVSLALFIAYNVVCIAKFGIPTSLSETHYLWKSLASKHNKKLPISVFGVLMVLITMPLLIFWLDKSDGTPQYLVFLSCVALLFVGYAPNFKITNKYHKLENRIHSIGAVLCALLSQLWIVLSTNLYFIPIILFAISIPLGLKIKGNDEHNRGISRSIIYFIELAAFISTYVCLGIRYIL